MHTKNCIACGKPAVMWTGHIHTEIGTIMAGWCNEHEMGGNRQRSNKCTSVNPHSCKGDYKLSEIELLEELNEENLRKQKESEAFSDMIDSQCSPNHPLNKRKSFWNHLFNW